jgi:hypothetical protein
MAPSSSSPASSRVRMLLPFSVARRNSGLIGLDFVLWREGGKGDDSIGIGAMARTRTPVLAQRRLVIIMDVAG